MKGARFKYGPWIGPVKKHKECLIQSSLQSTMNVTPFRFSSIILQFPISVRRPQIFKGNMRRTEFKPAQQVIRILTQQT